MNIIQTYDINIAKTYHKTPNLHPKLAHLLKHVKLTRGPIIEKIQCDRHSLEATQINNIPIKLNR